MLARRVIPCLDCDLQVPGGRVVKGIEFQQIRYAGVPWELARTKGGTSVAVPRPDPIIPTAGRGR